MLFYYYIAPVDGRWCRGLVPQSLLCFLKEGPESGTSCDLDFWFLAVSAFCTVASIKARWRFV